MIKSRVVIAKVDPGGTITEYYQPFSPLEFYKLDDDSFHLLDSSDFPSDRSLYHFKENYHKYKIIEGKLIRSD